MSRTPFLFWSKSEEWPFSCSRSLRIEKRVDHLIRIFLSVLHEMSLNIGMKITRPVKSGVTLNLDSNSWTLLQNCNVVNLGKIFHSNSSGSPSIRSKALYSVLKHVNLSSRHREHWRDAETAHEISTIPHYLNFWHKIYHSICQQIDTSGSRSTSPPLDSRHEDRSAWSLKVCLAVDNPNKDEEKPRHRTSPCRVATWTIASILAFLSPSTTPILYHVKDEAKSNVASLRTWTKHVFPYPLRGTFSSHVCKFTLMPSSTPSSEDDVLSWPAKENAIFSRSTWAILNMYFTHTSGERRNAPRQDHHSALLERTQRSSSKFASSSLKSILHSFSTAFRVDFISLKLSLFFLALAPTGKHATRRRRTSRNFSCNRSSLAARSTIFLRVHLRPRWTVTAAKFISSNRVIEMKFLSSSGTSTQILWQALQADTMQPPELVLNSRATSVEHPR